MLTAHDTPAPATETNPKKRKIRKFVNLGVFFCLTFYVAMSPALFYSRFEFLPEKFIPEKYAVADKIQHEDVFFTASNGKKLHGWYFAVPNAKNTVIVHHGQGANVAYFFPAAELFHNVGANVLVYDYEGFGRSEGPTAHEALRRDAEAAYFYVRNEKKIPADQIVHCGISLGTGAACDIAAHQPCKGVFLCSPYWKMSDVATNVVPLLRIYPRIAFPQPDIGAEELVTKNVPMLIVHSDNDPLIPVAGAKRIFEATKGQKQIFIVKNGSHVGGLAPGIEDFVKKWLDSITHS